MLDGLAIVLERMETHPEDFLRGRWMQFIDYDDYRIFNEEERLAIEKAKLKLQEIEIAELRQNYTEQVLEALTSADKSGYKRVKHDEIHRILKKGVAALADDHEFLWKIEPDSGRK